MPFPARAVTLIRERLDAGQLPTTVPPKMWAGFGSGEPCDGCDEPILRAQVGYEFEADGRTIRFHQACAGLWEAESRRRGYRRSGSETPGAP